MMFMDMRVTFRRLLKVAWTALRRWIGQVAFVYPPSPSHCEFWQCDYYFSSRKYVSNLTIQLVLHASLSFREVNIPSQVITHLADQNVTQKSLIIGFYRTAAILSLNGQKNFFCRLELVPMHIQSRLEVRDYGRRVINFYCSWFSNSLSSIFCSIRPISAWLPLTL